MLPLRFGIIGYGYTGRIHAQACMSQTCARLIAIAECAAEKLSDTPPDIRLHKNHEELLESDVDAVSICLPTHLHCKVAVDALESGKHVLVEKPMAPTLPEAQRMLRAAKAAGRVLYVGMTHRFYPELREAKRVVDDGTIGAIVACNDCALEHIGFLNTPRWYLEKRFSGGGPALTSGIHLVDRLRWFTGDEVECVTGSAGNPYFGGDVEDAGQMFLCFRGGISAQITVAFLREFHPLVCDLQVIGTRGSITVHTWRGYELWDAAGHKERIFYIDEPHRAKVQVGIEGELSEFCNSIAEGREPWPSAEEHIQSLNVIQAYYRAAEAGKTIELGKIDAL
jgi:predicted dehydrogenase